MPKDILLKSGRILRDTLAKGLEFAGEEVFTETDDVGAQGIMDNHESAYNHTQLHNHSNKSVLDSIGDAGSGQIITLSERNKVAAMDVAHYGTPLQTTVELSAIPEADCNDKERRYVEDELSDYFYDETAGTGDIAPDDQTGGTGFWRKVSVGGETAASIKTKYESNANTNAFTDAEQTKLGNITSTGSGEIITTNERARVAGYMTYEVHEITASNVTNGYFTLAATPIDGGESIRVEELNGVALLGGEYANSAPHGIDFRLFNTNEIHINNNADGTDLENSSIVQGDILLVSYVRGA